MVREKGAASASKSSNRNLPILQVVDERLQTQAITIGTKAANLTHYYWRNQRMMTKRFPTINITQVNLNGRDLHGHNRISQSHACMSIGSAID